MQSRLGRCRGALLPGPATAAVGCHGEVAAPSWQANPHQTGLRMEEHLEACWYCVVTPAGHACAGKGASGGRWCTAAGSSHTGSECRAGSSPVLSTAPPRPTQAHPGHSHSCCHSQSQECITDCACVMRLKGWRDSVAKNQSGAGKAGRKEATTERGIHTFEGRSGSGPSTDVCSSGSSSPRGSCATQHAAQQAGAAAGREGGKHWRVHRSSLFIASTVAGMSKPAGSFRGRQLMRPG